MCEAAIEDDPEDSWALQHLAHVLSESDEDDLASELATRAIRLAPVTRYLYELALNAALDEDRLDDARFVYEQFVAHFEDVDATEMLAEALREEFPDEAIELYLEVSQDWDVLEALTELLRARSRWHELVDVQAEMLRLEDSFLPSAKLRWDLWRTSVRAGRPTPWIPPHEDQIRVLLTLVVVLLVGVTMVFFGDS